MGGRRRAALVCALALATGSAPDTLASQSPAGQKPSATFRSGTRLISVSVVVRDDRGRPVSGLTADDFQLAEDGKTQTIAFFTEQTRVTASAPPPTAPTGTFTNRVDAVAESGVTIILFDRLNTRDTDQQQARDHVIKFLRQVNPDDRIGFYLLDGAGLSVLHDFTRDAASLLRALNRVSAPTSGALEGSETTLTLPGEEVDPKLLAMIERSEQAVRGFYMQQRAENTAAALEALGMRLAGVKGRKTIVWLSSGFPLVFSDGISLQNMSPEVMQATRALSSSDVAIYPVDARGLVSAFATAPGARNPQFTTLSTVMGNLDASQLLAEQTGGRAFAHTNDLGTAIARAIDDTSHSYVIGYYPINERWDARFRKIKVEVRNRKAVVRHRSGYFAHPGVAPTAATRRNAVLSALHSPLDATAVPFSVHAAPGPSANEITLTVRLEPGALSFRRDGDRWGGRLDVAIGQGLPDGRVFASADKTVPLSFTTQERDAVLADGLTLSQSFTVRDDAHQVRIVVRDDASDQVGSLTIPAARLRQPRDP